MPEAVFTGTQTLTYLGFTDVITGKVLVCDPGGTYTILPDIPQDGRFAALSQAEDLTEDISPEPEETEE